jgi:hypothetical protein
MQPVKPAEPTPTVSPLSGYGPVILVAVAAVLFFAAVAMFVSSRTAPGPNDENNPSSAEGGATELPTTEQAGPPG